MHNLFIVLLILVCLNAVLTYSSFRRTILVVLCGLWGVVMAGLILWRTETTLDIKAVWNVAQIGLWLESALLLIGCFANRNDTATQSAPLISRYPGCMLWLPLWVLADQVVRQNPGVSFGGLALTGGIAIALLTGLLFFIAQKWRISHPQKRHLIYLVNLFILLTTVLFDGSSL